MKNLRVSRQSLNMHHARERGHRWNGYDCGGCKHSTHGPAGPWYGGPQWASGCDDGQFDNVFSGRICAEYQPNFIR